MYNLGQLSNIVEDSFLSLKINKQPAGLYEPIEYMLSIGGKRLRPMTCLMTYNLFHKEITNEVIYPAMALEVFHAFTLIHDDIMDNAPVRRGKATVHKKWDANTAILSGDVMSIKAYELLAHTHPDKLPEALDLFIKTAIEVCEGQQYDMNFETLPEINMEDYIKMIGLKTGVLIACSAKMGALIAGADTKTCNILYDYAYNLGIAFQVMDDYLDSFGDVAVFGKQIGGDILNNKKTWLLVEVMKSVNGEERKELDEIINMPSSALNGADTAADNLKISRMTKFYLKNNIDKKALDAVEFYGKKALDLLEICNFTKEQKEQLRTYASKLLYRNK